MERIFKCINCHKELEFSEIRQDSGATIYARRDTYNIADWIYCEKCMNERRGVR